MRDHEVLLLMQQSKSEDEWNENCLKVKEAHGGSYPPFWFPLIIASGEAARIMASWGGSPEIRVETIG